MWTERDLDKRPPSVQAVAPDEAQARGMAIAHIQRRRRFQGRAVAYGAICTLLTAIWAVTEYSNAGGWPTSGFSQSSSIPHTWNVWIIYPVLGLVLVLAIDGWNTFGRRPISETEIQREVDRIRGGKE